MQNKVSVVPEEDLRDYRHCGRKDSYSVEMSLLREDSQAGMADTDLIENEIMFTQNERAAKLRAAKGRSKARDQYLSLLRPFLRFLGNFISKNIAFLALRRRKERNALCLEKSIHSASCRVPAGGQNENHL